MGRETAEGTGRIDCGRNDFEPNVFLFGSFRLFLSLLPFWEKLEQKLTYSVNSWIEKPKENRSVN